MRRPARRRYSHRSGVGGPWCRPRAPPTRRRNNRPAARCAPTCRWRRWSSTCEGSRRALGLKLIGSSRLRLGSSQHEFASRMPRAAGALPCRHQMADRATLHVIHEGSIDDDHVTSTVSLILDGDARMVVDPGMVADRRQIVDGIGRHGVEPGQVTHVLFTHHHPDHTLNAALFTNADVVDARATYRRDLWLDHSGDGFHPTPHVRLLATPGHSAQDVTWL